MIKPAKHLDLEKSVLRVSSEMLHFLRKRRIVGYNAILKLVKSKAGDDANVVVAPALNLLFLLGRIEYHVKNDTFEYVGPGGT